MTEATWKRFDYPEWGPDFSADGIDVYCVGEEGEYIVCFQNITPDQLIALAYEYELNVERFDSRAEFGEAYSVSDVFLCSMYLHTDKHGDPRLYWGPLTEEFPVKDRLALVLARW